MALYSEYVSPFDEAVRPTAPLADRPAGLAGRNVVLLDITKNRGEEYLDRLEERFEALGASVRRSRKEIFSRPASSSVIDDVAAHADLVVEALAD